MYVIKPVKLTLSLAPFVLALALAMDVYVPAIPKLTAFFSASDNVMLLTLSLFMLTSGLMQLVIGPASDSIGRKKMLYFVTFLFALGSIICALSNGMVVLIAGRIVQAIGSCGMMVLGFTIVRDCFKGDKSAQVYSYLNGIISFSPMFAPFIGAHLDILFGWRYTFLSLLVIAIFAVISARFYLPETLPKSRRSSFRLKNTLREYSKMFHSQPFVIYTLGTCFGLSYLYLFCAMSPFLIIRELHIPEAKYGFYFFYMGLSFFIGSVICGQVVRWLKIYRTCLLGFIITLIGGSWMAVWYVVFGLTLYGFIYPMLLVGIGGTFCMSAGNGGLMFPYEKNTGQAAALSGAMRFLFSSLAGMLVIRDEVASTLPLGVPAILFSLVGLILFLKFRHALVQVDNYTRMT